MSTETKATTRIRWADAPVSTSSSLAFTGRVGRIDEPQFFIYKPPLGSDEYILTTEVPGLDSRRGRADDPEKLEWLAEHWLEEFVSSLGASFMGEAGTDPKRASRTDRDFYGAVLAPRPQLTQNPDSKEQDQ